MTRWIPWLAFVVICAALPVFAVTPRQVPAPAPPLYHQLEITYVKGQPPSIQATGNLNGSPRGAWSTRFRRLPEARGDARGLPMYAVQVMSRIEAGGAVRVWVSVLLGES